MRPRHEYEDKLVTNISVNLRAAGLPDRDIVGRSDAFAVLYVDSRVAENVDGADHAVGMAPPAPPPETPGGPRDLRWDRAGMTETMPDNCNPRWAKSFCVPYYFERAQRIAVDVFDRDAPEDEPLSRHDFLGTAECSVPTLVRSRGKRLELRLKDEGRPNVDCGTITLIAEEEGRAKRMVELGVAVRGLRLGFSERGSVVALTMSRPSDGSMEEARRGPSSLMFARPISVESVAQQQDHSPLDAMTTGAGMNDVHTDWIAVAGPVSSRKVASDEHVFDSFGVNCNRLCFSDDSLRLQMDVLGRKNVPIATASSSLGEWKKNPSLRLTAPTADASSPRSNWSSQRRRDSLLSSLPGGRRRAKDKELGQLVLSHSREYTQYSFLDYVFSGHEISLAIAIDFTASNGDPQQRGSLHHIDKNVPNEYEVAIHSVGDILATYDSDQLFPAYGFGAKLPPLFRTPSHCFTLTGSDDPLCVEIEGVLEAYRQTLYNVRFSGPTVFAEIIRAASEHVQEDIRSGSNTYTIMLIVTDGVINDMQDTVDEIVRASSLPLSIVIIGVGASDFTEMEGLDGDDERLVSSSGHMAERDIVQFVPFRKFRGAPEVLAAKVLEEIPEQFMSYMSKHNIIPAATGEIGLESEPVSGL